MSKRTKCTLILFIVSATLFLIPLFHVIRNDYIYDRDIQTYVNLADDASTAQAKLGYLILYRDLCMNKINREEARYIFKTKQKTHSEQIKILDTLIQRLQNTNQMDPKSFEYQTAMNQLTGQEFETTLKTTNEIMYSCYIRDSVMKFSGYFILPFYIIYLIILFIILMIFILMDLGEI